MSTKIAILSDIHGNACALEAVLRDMERQNIDQALVLGDLAFRGAEPKRCIALIQSLECPVIGGNADQWVVRGIHDGEVPSAALSRMRTERDWSVQHLDDGDLAYLQGLPDTAELQLPGGHALFGCHATPNDRFTVIAPHATDEQLLMTYFSGEVTSKAPGMLVAAYGHIHLPYTRFLKGHAIVNPGSVGLPFDGLAKASYAILHVDGTAITVSMSRVGYDLARALEALERVDYPFADRLGRILTDAVAP